MNFYAEKMKIELHNRNSSSIMKYALNIKWMIGKEWRIRL